MRAVGFLLVLSSLASLLSATPLVIGHRGFSAKYPENTVAAFEAAFTHGAHGIETDLHLSKDGHIVLMHDDWVNRTTNGTGRLSQMTLSQIKTLDAGMWKDKQFAGQRVPTFEEALVIADKHKGFIVMDVKSQGVGPALSQLMAKHSHMVGRVIASCWSVESGHHIRAHVNHTISQKLGTPPPNANNTYFSYMVSQGVRGFSAKFSKTTRAFVQGAKQHLLSVYVWTVNKQSDINRALEIGVDGVITNEVQQMRQWTDHAVQLRFTAVEMALTGVFCACVALSLGVVAALGGRWLCTRRKHAPYKEIVEQVMPA